MYYRKGNSSDSSFQFGKGWPAYKDVSVKEMENNIGNMPDMPRPAQNTPMQGMPDMNRPAQNTPMQGMPNMNRPTQNSSMQNRPMQNMPMDGTMPRYDTMPGSSTYSSDDAMVIRDRELLNQLYTNINRIMLPYIVSVIAEFDYMGSPIYDEQGIDRETLAQLISRVLDLAQKDIDEVEEIRTENNPYPMEWNRNMLIKNMTEALLLCYIFNNRRPRYRAIRQNYAQY